MYSVGNLKIDVSIMLVWHIGQLAVKIERM